MGVIELHYWRLRGLGQSILTLMEHLKLDYQFFPVTDREQWVTEKEKLKEEGFLLANLPYIKDGDFMLAESQVIMRYICKKAERRDLLPSASEEDKFNELASAVSDVKSIAQSLFYSSKSIEELSANLKEVFAGRIASQSHALSVMIGSSGFLFGRLTFLDFVFAEFLTLLFTFEKEQGVEVLPYSEIFKKYVSTIDALPGVAEYKSSERFLARPFNGPSAIWS